MADERPAIDAAINTYLDGLYEGDTDKLASVFHATSALTWEEGGDLTLLVRDEWLEAVRRRPSAIARGFARHDMIQQIDQATPTMAFVKLNCAIPPRFFTDYLCLLKVGAKWQTAQKVFASELRE